MPRSSYRGSLSTLLSWRFRLGAALGVLMLHAAIVGSCWRMSGAEVPQVLPAAPIRIRVIEASAPAQSTLTLSSAADPQQAGKPAAAPRGKSLPSKSTAHSRRASPSPPAPEASRPPAFPSSAAVTATQETPLPLQALPASDEPVRVSAVEYAGQRPQPTYPRLSLERREEGAAVVLVDIDTQGRVVKAVIDTSSGYARLDQAALQAARQARFKPYTYAGVAYSSQTKLPFIFTIKRN